MTIKSDDVVGRNKAFRAILEGKEIPLPTYPSSFGYMTKLLQGLGLQLLVETNEGETSDANVFFSTEVPTKPNSKLISTVSSTYEEVQE
jgi:DNA-directed RNA polymerase subunit beta